MPGVSGAGEAGEEVAELTDSELFALDDEAQWNAPNNVSDADFLRAMGATDEEINNAIAKEQGIQGADIQGSSGAQEAAGQQAPGSAAQGNAEARAGDEGLTAQDA